MSVLNVGQTCRKMKLWTASQISSVLVADGILTKVLPASAM
jgi:hypothetical protein